MPTELTMPRLSQDMESGRVVEWLKNEGDRIERGEPVLTVETDKAETDVEATDSGVLLRIVAPVGTDATIGSVLAIVGREGEVAEGEASAGSGTGTPSPVSTAPAGAVSAAAAPPASSQTEAPALAAGRRPSSPAAKRVARELGVDLASVVGTGDGGLVTEADVRAHATGAAPARAAMFGSQPASGPDDVEAVPLEGMRRRIAERMSLSRQTAADVTTVIDVDMAAVARVRTATRLSYTSYVAWAIARTLVEFPDLNATLVNDTILRRRRVDLGVAVALESGLIVPVVRDAHTKTVQEIEVEVDRLASAARDGKIAPADVSGASFTLTNSGTYGSLFFTPIINVPEVAILGIGRVADVPVVRDGQVVPGKVAYLCLSYDHRAVDGATAVNFLAAVKRRLQDIETETGK